MTKEQVQKLATDYERNLYDINGRDLSEVIDESDRIEHQLKTFGYAVTYDTTKPHNGYPGTIVARKIH